MTIPNKIGGIERVDYVLTKNVIHGQCKSSIKINQDELTMKEKT